MRPIKYRLWQPGRKRMIYSDSDLSNNIQIYMNGSVAWNGVWITDKVEIMQFTGLHDSTGKEIYEGDILKWIHGHQNYDFDINMMASIGITVFDIPSYKALFKIDNRIKSIVLADYFSKSLEVIGNIHSNLELLETK